MMGSVVFLSVALLIALFCAGALIWVVMRTRPDAEEKGYLSANTDVYRSQLADLEAAYKASTITKQEWHQSRDELSVRLLEDTATPDDQPASPAKSYWKTAATLLVALPVASISLYLSLGNPDALLSASAQASTPGPQQELTKMADGLAAKLAAQPDDVEGWVMLGRTYRTMGQFAAALQAYDRATRIDDGDDLKLERAEVVAASNGDAFEGEPWFVIRGILDKQPQHVGALLLAGSASYAEQQLTEALQYWQRARGRMTPDHPDVPALEAAMLQVQQQLGQAPASDTTKTANMPQASESVIRGRVSLAANLKNAVRPDDTVFVYAVQINGSRMPVAIVKTTVAQLPLSFTLDDSTAMNPALRLSTLSEVMLKARVSKSGSAMSQPGDLIGTLGPVSVGQRGVAIAISERMP